MCKTRRRQESAQPWRRATSWFLRSREGLKVRDKSIESSVVVFRIRIHFGLRILGLRVANISGKIFRRCGRPRGEHEPRMAGFLASLTSCIVAAQAILLGDSIT